MLKINFSNSQRKVKLPTNTKKLLTSAAEAVLKIEDFFEPAEINITFVSDSRIRKINKAFRDIDRSTDVLSFPMGEDGIYDVNPENGCLILGDVIISVEHAVAQSKEFGHGFDREMAYLTVHSVLHLLGYDHIDEGEQKRLMRLKEESALALIGLQIDKEQ